ncbi:transcriptional regulator [Gordonia sp. MP11Mi]|uniref:4Fe-4S Wbl-type domain-containing protein n=1 Tax=Gordonia sp. MP11Mi TaxID=3022769 RepID=A0AA97CX17_9ACTN
MTANYDPTGTIDLLSKVLADSPKLTGAACIGHHELFDAKSPDETPETVEDRHERAAALCWQCPALDDCTEWASSLSRSARPAGLVATRAPRPGPRPGRPKSAAS